MGPHATQLFSSRYPSRQVGGLFVTSLGAVTVASAVLGRLSHPPVPMAALFFPGLAASVALLVVMRRRLTRAPLSRANSRGLMLGFAVETAGLAFTFGLLADSADRTRWLAVLLVVGLHFVPMRWTHGPAMAVLGAACAANAGLGLLVASTPFVVVALVDGGVKLLAGAWLMRSQPTTTA